MAGKVILVEKRREGRREGEREREMGCLDEGEGKTLPLSTGELAA